MLQDWWLISHALCVRLPFRWPRPWICYLMPRPRDRTRSKTNEFFQASGVSEVFPSIPAFPPVLKGSYLSCKDDSEGALDNRKLSIASKATPLLLVTAIGSIFHKHDEPTSHGARVVNAHTDISESGIKIGRENSRKVFTPSGRETALPSLSMDRLILRQSLTRLCVVRRPLPLPIS